jgi:hypothetical protein
MVPVAEQILRLSLGFIASQALRVVADLEIADRLAGGAESVDALSVETGTHTDALYRTMRVLAAEGVFRETLPRHFGLTELGGALRSDAPSGARDFIRMINPRRRGKGPRRKCIGGHSIRVRRLFRHCSFRGRCLHLEAGYPRLGQ